ncbi:endomucin isoform X2 [Tachyglossus aculeatus]|uniref:endomucin isoform X2 n=1 Tax=Tachyglossus aculeatus TaxID=9261 RepID=UPI0018F63FAC|nr:endomucin isoform X2 [Tachyglossus aculeatus]
MKLLQVTFLSLSLFSLCHPEDSPGPSTRSTPVAMSSTKQTTSTVPGYPPSASEAGTTRPMTTTETTVTPTITSTAAGHKLTTTVTASVRTSSSKPVTPTFNTSDFSSSSENADVKSTLSGSTQENTFSTVNSSTHLSTIQASTPLSTRANTKLGHSISVKSTNSPLTSPAYSGVILPVVIALIVITLSVFILVGLYRMCRKTDPGSPENGTDQPQSDKESVKLLTVKTLSPETGEQSAQGKNKN